MRQKPALTLTGLLMERVDVGLARNAINAGTRSQWYYPGLFGITGIKTQI
jgi:hypothetical protein